MQVRQSVLLRHRMRGGDHYDWMLETPTGAAAAEAGKLLTWRLSLPSWQWRAAGGDGWRRATPSSGGEGFGGRSATVGAAAGGAVMMEQLVAHRRDYLRRTGPISGGRGAVRQADVGYAIVRQWHDDGGCLELRLRHFRGLVRLTRGPAMRWRLHVLG